MSSLKKPAKKLWLGDYTYSDHQLTMRFGVDDLQFMSSYWYQDANLTRLVESYGKEYMEKVFFHIMAIESSKLVSLRPETFDLGRFKYLHTEKFEMMWNKLINKVWAQWRYEHNDPHYPGPRFLSEPKTTGIPTAVKRPDSDIPVLSLCGGGKDSIVSMKLLERAGIPYASYAYSHSIYGSASHQHELIDALLDTATPTKRLKQWVFDDFMDSPVLELNPEYEVKHILAAETPNSLFGIVPIILEHGFQYVSLGHERSADVGNLIWDVTGEDVNHQWGKALEAELLMNDYLKTELVSNFSHFGILKAIYDVVIFQLLRKDLDSVPSTHSCNIRKPWCCKCPKCSYVWLNYMAYLPVELVNSIFKQNLFDIEDNQLWFKQMLGLGEHTPFECIGQIDETRLAFELCKAKGLSGKAMDMYQKAFPNLDVMPIIDKYCTVDASSACYPTEIEASLLNQMQTAAQESRQQILQTLNLS